MCDLIIKYLLFVFGMRLRMSLIVETNINLMQVKATLYRKY